MKRIDKRPGLRRVEIFRLAAGLALVGLAARGAAVSRYVAPNAPNPGYPYDSWETAGPDLAEVVAAANANNSGDVVHVAAGTYYLTNQVVVGNTVVSNTAGDRALTIIDGNYPAYTNRCFYLNHAKSWVTGFTIRNGHTWTNDLLGQGAGVYMTLGTVRDCTIEGNYAQYEINNYRGGGGVYMASGYLLDSDIRANTAHGIKELNRGALHGGGGVFAAGGLISNCWMQVNTGTTACAGGVFLWGSMRDSVVCNNYAAPAHTGYGGGGISTFRANTIENVRIFGNTTRYNGGGMFINDATTTALKMRNCLIAGNTAGGNGGGVYGSYPLGNNQESIANCTIVSNEAVLGGGIYFKNNSTTSIVNTIIYHNRSTGDSDPNLYDLVAPGNAHTILQSCVEPGTATFVIPNAVAGPPRFVNPSAGNWRLRADSPCVNAGTNRVWMTLDLDGNPRIRYGDVDLGAYEAVRRGLVYWIR